MADGGPIEIEAGIESPADDWPPPSRHSSSRRLARGWGGWRTTLVAVVVMALAAGALGATVMTGGGGSAEPDAAPDETVPPAPPGAWARVPRQLRRVGSFDYRGTVRAREPNAIRPGRWLAEEVAAEGTVLIGPRVSREVAVDGRGRAVETVTAGSQAWSRTAPSADELAGAPWSVAPVSENRFQSTWPGQTGVGLVAEAVLLAGDQHSDPPDGSGRQTLRATVSTRGRGGQIAEMLDGAEISLLLDGGGDLDRIQMTIPPTDRSGVMLDLTVDRLGESTQVTPDQVAESIRRTLRPHRLEPAGVRLVELGAVPSGWALGEASIGPESAPPNESCLGVRLHYRDLFPNPVRTSGDWLSLWVTSDECRAADDWHVWDEPFRAGSFSGTAAVRDRSMVGSISDGRTSVLFDTSLSAGDAARVLASLRPFDPAGDVSAISGLPSS